MNDKRQQIRRAEHVQELLKDKELKSAWASVESDIVAMWGNTASDEADKREALYREWHGLKAVRARLERVVNAGKLASYTESKEKG